MHAHTHTHTHTHARTQARTHAHTHSASITLCLHRENANGWSRKPCDQRGLSHPVEPVGMAGRKPAHNTQHDNPVCDGELTSNPLTHNITLNRENI